MGVHYNKNDNIQQAEPYRMEFMSTAINDVILIQPKVFGDERGFFLETYRAERFAQAGIPTEFVQDNHSGSVQGILRGLHYQIRQAQGKLVRVVCGQVYDVAVDLRRSSPTFGRWVGQILSSENKIQIWIPAGFAHGFYVMSDWAEVVYKTTAYYAPEWERTLIWNDPEVGIDWPVIQGKPPILSQKDARGGRLMGIEVFE
jgi:dTDP-4-dehydrorhamnose 3,5-epimerase